MMISRILYGNVFSSLEISTNNLCYFLKVSLKKKEIHIEQVNQFLSLSEFINFKKSTSEHIYLNVNNEKVLSKVVKGFFKEKRQAIYKAFPKVKTVDFSFNVVQGKEFALVSMIRKSELEKLILQLKEQNISVFGVSIGKSNLLSFGEIIGKNFIELNEDGIQVLEKSISLDSTTQLENNQLINFSSALGFYKNQLFQNLDEYSMTLKKDFIQKRIFNLGMRFSLAFALIMLTINFIFFSIYSSKLSKIIDESTVNQSTKSQLTALTEMVDKKRTLVNSMNSISDSKVSWILNEVFYAIPQTSILDEVEYQPREKFLREGEPIKFLKNQILVRGSSKNDADFTQWLDELEKRSWIKEIRGLNYGLGSKQKNNFEFIIEIQNGL